jgi:hypothetical protein
VCVRNKYDIAYAAHSEASTVFMAAQKAYRARLIGDVEFLQAREVLKAADAAFDAAYAAEAAREPAQDDVVVEEDRQRRLF